MGGNGYEDNNTPGGIAFFNNVAYKNRGKGFEALNTTLHVLKNNVSLGNGKPDDILAGSDVSNNSWNGLAASDADFVSVDDAIAIGPRQPDGSLPRTDFLRPRPTSALIDRGVDVGLPFIGQAPDLGRTR